MCIYIVLQFVVVVVVNAVAVTAFVGWVSKFPCTSLPVRHFIHCMYVCMHAIVCLCTYVVVVVSV